MSFSLRKFLGWDQFDPRQLPYRAFDYDAEAFASMVKDSVNRVTLFADRFSGSKQGLWDPTCVALYCSGATGAYASLVDDAAFDFGDFGVFAKITPVSYTPSSEQAIVAKWTTSGNQKSFALVILASGKLRLYWSEDGSTNKSIDSSVALSFTALQAGWVYATLDVDNGAGNHQVKFYYASDTVGIAEPTWTQLGTTVLGAGGTTSIYASSAIVSIGAINTGNSAKFQGKVHFVGFRSGYDGAGSIVAGIDFTSRAPGVASFTEITGKTVTINSPALIGWFDTTNLLALNATSGNYPSTPDTVASSFSTGFEVLARVTFNALGTATVASKWSDTSNQRSIRLAITATDAAVVLSADGSTSPFNKVLGAHGLTALTTYWLRYTFENNVGGNVRVVAYKAADTGNNTPPSSWTQIGSDNTVATFSLFDSTAGWALGSHTAGASALADAKFHYFEARATIGGARVTGVDFSKVPKLATSVAGDAGEIWTINASGASGARISAPRDAYWATVGGQPIHVSEDSNGCYTTPGLGISTAGVDRDCINSDGSTAGRRISWQLGAAGALAGQAQTGRLEFVCPASAVAATAFMAGVASSASDLNQAWSMRAYISTVAGSLRIRQEGAIFGTDYRYLDYPNFITDYAGQWVRLAVVISSPDSTTKPGVWINGVDKTASFTVQTNGSVPNWAPASMVSTYQICGQDWIAGRFVPHPWTLGAYTAAEAIAWTGGGSLPSWATSYSGTVVKVTSGSLTVGRRYIISDSGGTFTGVGAADNNIGTIFDATGTTPTWGTGSVRPLGRLFVPVLQPTQTIADAGTNGITGTLATGCNPILYKPGSYLCFDGSDDALQTPKFPLSQPVNVYAVLKLNSWTSGRLLLDGSGVSNRAQLEMRTASPRFDQYAGAYGASLTTFVLNSFGVLYSLFNGTSSLLRRNREAAATGSAGTEAMNGVTIANVATSSANASNLCLRRLVGFDTVVHSESTQNKVIKWLGKRKRIIT